MTDWYHLYVVYRLDRFKRSEETEPVGLNRKIKIKEILPGDDNVAREVERLNHLRDDGDEVKYFWQAGKFYPDGRDVPFQPEPKAESVEKIDEKDRNLSYSPEYEKRFKATLRLAGKGMEASEISKKLGSEPTGVSQTSTGSTVWRLESPTDEAASLDEQIDAIFEEVTDRQAQWEDLIVENDLTGDVFVGVFSDSRFFGHSLEPQTVRKIGERFLKLDFDIYVTGKHGPAP